MKNISIFFYFYHEVLIQIEVYFLKIVSFELLNNSMSDYSTILLAIHIEILNLKKKERNILGFIKN